MPCRVHAQLRVEHASVVFDVCSLFECTRQASLSAFYGSKLAHEKPFLVPVMYWSQGEKTIELAQNALP